jgi:C-terminal processing protease CtpA/Prc
MEWTASLPEDAEWAYIESGEAGTDSGEIVVRYDLNGGAERELEVTVTAAAASNSPQSLALSQEWLASGVCTYPEARQEMFNLMRNYYYFNDESEQQAKYDDITLEDHSSLNGMLGELRWMPETRDRGFTYWLTEQQTRMIFDAESYIFGFRLIFIVDQNGDVVHIELLDVHQGSPAADAGFQRGDKILSMNGKALAGMTISQINTEFGPNEDGYEVTFELEKISGARSTHVVAKRLVQIPVVPAEHVSVFDTDKGKVGYLHFRTFFGDAAERLLDEFSRFNAQGVRHLIIDLRYNGGGSVPIAHALATLVGGPELFESNTRTLMVEQVHNMLLASFGWNEKTYFDCRIFGGELMGKCQNEGALRDLENVVFITSRGSASASELVISALQPYENVTLVGERTYGKPVGQYLFPACEDQSGVPQIRFLPVSFATVNADGLADYYEGFPVECEVPDDRSHQLGDAQEGRIAEALRFIETGSCEAPASARIARARSAVEAVPPQDPIKQFLGY